MEFLGQVGSIRLGLDTDHDPPTRQVWAHPLPTHLRLGILVLIPISDLSGVPPLMALLGEQALPTDWHLYPHQSGAEAVGSLVLL
jgi:hypothetical protein